MPGVTNYSLNLSGLIGSLLKDCGTARRADKSAAATGGEESVSAKGKMG